jgi:hypothetical protein
MKTFFFMFFLISLIMLDFVIQRLYDIQIKTNKFCIARIYLCKKNSQTEIGKNK